MLSHVDIGWNKLNLNMHVRASTSTADSETDSEMYSTSSTVGHLNNATAENSSSVNSYLEQSRYFLVATHLWKAIDVVGLIGNFLCVLVMTRKGMRRLPFAVCAGVLAISDSCVLVAQLLYNIDLTLPDVQIVTSSCGIQGFIYFVSSEFSSWCLVCITIERFIAVNWPLDCHIIVSRKKVSIALAVICVTLVLINIHALWNTGQDTNGACVWKEEFYLTLFHTICVWVDISLFSIIPFVLISTLNCLIICKLCRTQISEVNALNTKRQRDIVFTLFGVSMAFILLTSPICIYTLNSYIRGEDFDTMSNWAVTGYVLQETNFAINFYVYCLTGRRVRQELKKMFSCTEYRNDTVEDASASTRDLTTGI